MVRGAVERGVGLDGQNEIYVRRCRRNYGISVSQPFSASKHLETDAYVDAFDDKRKAKEQMVWLIRKGDAILSTQPKRASISQRWQRRSHRLWEREFAVGAGGRHGAAVPGQRQLRRQSHAQRIESGYRRSSQLCAGQLQ